jgi:hypothetical protein
LRSSGAGVCATYQEPERTGATGADDESGEAQRVAGELVKLHRDGAFADASDLEARFYAQVLHVFGGTYATNRPDKKEAAPAPGLGPYVATKEQGVVVPPGLTAKERMKFLQDDLDSAFGE